MNLNIAFFGTSDRATPLLEALNGDPQLNLKLVVTKTDRKMGRHQKLKPTQVKEWAEKHNIAKFELKNQRDFQKKEKALLRELSKQRIDLIIVADFGFMVPETLIQTYKGKIINVHFSLLPKYRGANPVQAAIINGDKETGITFILMEEGLDSGPILHQIKHPLTKKETTGMLYKELFDLAAKRLPETVKKYANQELTPQQQDDSKAEIYYSPSHPKSTYIYKEDAKINWNETPQQIEQKIRAFNPWPIAWTTLEALEHNEKLEDLALREGVDASLRVKIFSAEVVEKEMAEAGSKKSKLIPKTIQVAGKKKTSWENFKNGYAKK
ncbi:methionyl-tRNA formyltransferase [candidate division WWE3 bacterium]|nr:methionyl-tRNA formyltransferase [candidate division WWE3 bacterium]